MARRTRSADPARPEDRALRETILSTTRQLLADHRFDELTVADILTAAGVSRGSFYFYFESKHDVLAELVERAITQGHAAAEAWLEHAAGREATLRQGILGGAMLWQDQAPVLRAIVENWRTDPKLAQLWQRMMDGFTEVTLARIEQDAATGGRLPDGVDPRALAASLTWLGERIYYLAAISMPPFDDQDALVGALTHIWMSVLPPEAGPA
jgi:AcrR family transcriptional regulator